MRITLLLLAAGLSVAASGGAAAAELARGSMIPSGVPHGAWKPGGFGHGPGYEGGWPNRPHPGRGRDRHDRHDRYDRHDRHDRHDRWRGHHGNSDILYSYGGGIGYSYEAVNPHGSGFFADGGGAVRVRGDRAYYDYDRSYPYEWASRSGAGRGRADEARRGPAEVLCGLENGVRVCRGRR